MDGQPTTPTQGRRRAAGFDKLGSVLAAVVTVTGASAFLSFSTLTWRDNAVLFTVAVAAFAGGMACLIAFRDGGTVTPGVARLRSLATVILFAVSLGSFLFLISRAEVTDSKPVISAVATGDGPLTISGSATAAGLRTTERVSVKIIDQEATRFQAVAGSASEAGRATIPFEFELNAQPDREITIVAWLTDRVSTEPSCTDSAVIPGVSCLTLALHAPRLIAPRLTISPNLLPGARSVTITLVGMVGPGDGVQVDLWDREALLHSFIARPGPDGKVDSSTVVPMHDNKAVLCAVAQIAAEPTVTSVPIPCIGTTFANLVIPAAPGPSATAAPAP